MDGCESVRMPADITIITYPIRYVKAGATGNGKTWATASGNIQEMIDAPLTEEVWVAEGTYLPAVKAGNGTYDRDKTFLLKNGVKVYGGFPAAGTPAMQDRDWEAHETILSGDLGTPGNTTDNAFHIVIIAGQQNTEPEETILDGFTLTGGNADTDSSDTSVYVNNVYVSRTMGGGLYIGQYASAVLANLNINNNYAYLGGGISIEYENTISIAYTTISDNSAASDGGGIYNNGTLTLDHVSVNNNNALSGAGIYNGWSSDSFFNNIIVNNNTSISNGAGIYNSSAGYFLKNSVISGNVSTSNGGGIFNESSIGNLTNVQITGNRTSAYGGGMYNLEGLINLTNVTISANDITVGLAGVAFSGAVFNHDSDVVTANSIIYGNDGGVVNFVSYPTYANSLVQGVNDTTNGNIGGNIDPLFVSMPSYETAPFTTGNFALQSNSPVINAGSDTQYTILAGNTLTDEDYEGNPRFAGVIDMGAYEYQGEVSCQYTTIWNGATWSNGVPAGYQYAAIIDGNFTSSENLTACSLSVYSGSVTIQAGHTFNIKGAIAVSSNATFTVQNNGAIVQVDDVANSGTIIFHRASAELTINKATLWSAPVSGQPLDAFSPATAATGFKGYVPTPAGQNTYGAFTTLANTGSNFNAATGYLISMPQAISGTNAAAYQAGSYSLAFDGAFTGTPHNGNVTAALSTTGDLYSAIGNPYPSPVSITNFFEAANGLLDPSSALYLWSEAEGATGYTMVTSTSFVSNNPGSGTATAFSGNPSSWNIAPAQGFMVLADGQASQFIFTNGMRRNATASQAFFKTLNEPQLSRLWISLTASNGVAKQASIAYSEAGTINIDAGMEGKLPPASSNTHTLYSMVQNVPLAIQTRPEFVNTDVVQLGYSATVAGQYTVSLNNADGLLEESSQGIYLKDLAQNGLITNLKQGNYTFTTEAGTFESRFEIVYTQTTNGIGNVQYANTIFLYKNENSLHLDAGQTVVSKVVLYDITGRKIYEEDNINKSATTFKLTGVDGRVLIAEIYTKHGKVTKKVLY